MTEIISRNHNGARNKNAIGTEIYPITFCSRVGKRLWLGSLGYGYSISFGWKLCLHLACAKPQTHTLMWTVLAGEVYRQSLLLGE